MYCAKLRQFAYQCSPKRLKRWKGEFCCSFFSVVPSYLYPSSIFQDNQVVNNNVCLQNSAVPFLYRAKKLSHLGLLALFFCRLKWNY